jgi:outer membrane receptor protein involved in Fe transport
MIAGAMALGMTAAPFMSTAAFAQDYTSGAVEGVVYDADGTRATGVVVNLKSTSRGFERSVTSDANGSYRFQRLPIGDYVVGIQGGEPEAFRMSVGTTTKKDFVTSGDLDEIVATGTITQVFDFEAATTGLTLDVDETFKNIPLPRNITALTLLTPGAGSGDSAFGNLVSLGGSSVAENVYYVNGMNTTDFRNFLGSASVPFEFYEQVQTKTGGLPAEFGRTTGGVSNAVTKSGSNEWKFGASVYHDNADLRSTSRDIRSQGDNSLLTARRDATVERTEYNFWASGPIIKDRVFAYGLYSPRKLEQRVNSINSGYTEVITDSDPFYGGKLDINITDKHLLEFTGWRTFNSRESERFDATFDSTDGSLLSQGGESSLAFGESGGNIYMGKYTGQIADWLTVSAMYGEQENAQTVQSAADIYPNVYDNRIAANGFVNIGRSVNFLVDEGDDKRKLFRADADLYVDDMMGDHHFRLGYDQEKLTANAATVLSGGTYYVYRHAAVCDSQRAAPTGEECLRIREYSSGGMFDVKTTAYYLQDSWDVTDSLTLNLGIRNETFENFNGTGDGFIKIENQWAPRMSFAYQPSMDESGTFFGSYARYFLPVAANTNIRAAGAETFIHRWYEFDAIDTSTPDNLPIFDPATLFSTQIFGDGTAPEPDSLVDRNIKPQNMDEFVIGYNTSLEDKFSGELGNWSVGAALTYNKINRVIEDISIDQGVLAYCDDNGIAGCDAAFGPRILHQYVLTNPGFDVDVVVDDLPGGPQRITLTAEQLGYPKAKRTYKGLELKFDRNNADDKLNLSGSWTISKSEGNYEGAVKSDNGQDDTGLTTDFDFPQLMDNADGYLPNHRLHKFKLYGNYQFTDSISVGANLQVSSPRKFGCLGADPEGFTTDLYGSAWYCGGVATPRGSQIESDWSKTLDLNFGFEVPDFPTGTLVLRADVFNVFNDQSILDRNEFGSESVNSTTGVLSSDLSEYGRASRYQSPRYVRFGADWRF